MMDKPDGFLTVAETAKLLRRSTEQVRRYLREGTLPGRRLGGQWFIQREDVERMLQSRREPGKAKQDLAASDPDPLSEAIAVAGSGGADIASGRIAYFNSLGQRP